MPSATDTGDEGSVISDCIQNMEEGAIEGSKELHIQDLIRKALSLVVRAHVE